MADVFISLTNGDTAILPADEEWYGFVRGEREWLAANVHHDETAHHDGVIHRAAVVWFREY